MFEIVLRFDLRCKCFIRVLVVGQNEIILRVRIAAMTAVAVHRLVGGTKSIASRLAVQFAVRLAVEFSIRFAICFCVDGMIGAGTSHRPFLAVVKSKWRDDRRRMQPRCQAEHGARRRAA